MRRLALVGLAAVASVFALSSAHPQSARAWAWSDTCAFTIINNTGSAGNVHPYLYLPVPPDTNSIALFTVIAAAGVPTGAGNAPTLSNTGVPLTWGCTASLDFSNPGSDVDCSAYAPTKGDNAFSCNGNSTYQVTEDDDDIRGNVFIPQGSGPGAVHAPHVVLRTKPPPHGLLRRSDLPGKGWRTLKKLPQIGLVGKLWTHGSVPASCKGRAGNDTGVRLVDHGASGFFRRGRAIGDMYGVYGSGAGARTMLAEALSRKSVHCFARILGSAKPHAHAAFTRRGAVHRVVVKTSGERYLVDMVGIARGSASAIVFFVKKGKPFDAFAEGEVVSAARSRLGRRLAMVSAAWQRTWRTDGAAFSARPR